MGCREARLSSWGVAICSRPHPRREPGLPSEGMLNLPGPSGSPMPAQVLPASDAAALQAWSQLLIPPYTHSPKPVYGFPSPWQPLPFPHPKVGLWGAGVQFHPCLSLFVFLQEPKGFYLYPDWTLDPHKLRLLSLVRPLDFGS